MFESHVVASIDRMSFEFVNKFFWPTSRNVLPTFQTFCPVGVRIAQAVVHFTHFQVQARKRGVLGGLWGALCMYISPKEVCDG